MYFKDSKLSRNSLNINGNRPILNRVFIEFSGKELIDYILLNEMLCQSKSIKLAVNFTNSYCKFIKSLVKQASNRDLKSIITLIDMFQKGYSKSIDLAIKLFNHDNGYFDLLISNSLNDFNSLIFLSLLIDRWCLNSINTFDSSNVLKTISNWIRDYPVDEVCSLNHKFKVSVSTDLFEKTVMVLSTVAHLFYNRDFNWCVAFANCIASLVKVDGGHVILFKESDLIAKLECLMNGIKNELKNVEDVTSKIKKALEGNICQVETLELELDLVIKNSIENKLIDKMAVLVEMCQFMVVELNYLGYK